MRTRHLVIALVVGTVASACLMFVRLGGFSARAQPSPPERLVARAVRRLAVPRAGRDARNPISFSPEVWAEARAHFADHCASCHGNDGRGDTDMGRNLYPKAPDMRLPDTQRLTDGELYWIIQNGVRLTGMPAWGDGSGSDADTWKLVHFVRHVKDLTEEQLEEMEALNPKSPSELEEERQDRMFLQGNEPDSTSPTPPRHQEILMSSMTVHGLVGALVGFFSALTLVPAGWIMMQPVSAKNTIAYHGVVTPACERMAGQAGGDEWTPSGVGADCAIEFREDVSGASVFVFGMGSVASPLSVSVGKKSISFLALGPNVSGNGFSFLVIR